MVILIEVRKISPGAAEGPVLLSQSPMSFLGDIDRDTGTILGEAAGNRGKKIQGRVLAFPHGVGSTVGSYVLYGLCKRGLGPSAIVNENAEAVVAVGAIMSGIPMIDRAPLDVLRPDDVLRVDADAGTLEIKGLQCRKVVTSFVQRQGRVLLLKRSKDVGSFQGRWAGVSGYLERDEQPLQRAKRELEEEVGVKAKLLGKGSKVYARNGEMLWIVHPFLFEASSRNVRLDWEHTEARWVRPSEVSKYRTVPNLEKALSSALSSVKKPRRGL